MREEAARARLSGAKRVVVKVGSRVLAEDDEAFDRIAIDLAAVARDRRVVLVSSGAIACGMAVLGMARRPRAMASLQAAAAAGQGQLMNRWAEALGRHGARVAQVLLSHADLASRVRVNNARAALTKLLGLGVLPIVNENDAVAVDEIRFGDNDELAAMVTPLVDGEVLVLLSDVEGVLDASGERVGFATEADELLGYVRPGTSTVGTGGMASKVESARRATLAGAHAVIASARAPGVLGRILAGDPVGTLLPARARRLSGRKHWIAYTLRPKGAALLDDGAVRAVVEDGKSVLGVGVVGVRGQFAAGDMISLRARDGHEVARGLARRSSFDAARLAGEKGEEAMLVHRDDLVVL